MDIRHMEALIGVVEAGSFSQAGRVLHLTQPTISAHVGALEQELGVRLLERSGSAVSPTEAGRLLYAYAKQILALRDEAVETITRISHVMEGTITLAASTVPGHYYLPELMQRFREDYPDIRFELQITDSADVVHKVSGRRADLGFTGTVLKNRSCVYHSFALDHLVLITPNEERFRRCQAGDTPLMSLLTEPFLSREPGSGTRRETERFFRDLGVDPAGLRTVVEAAATESILTMVSQGMGVSVVSARACTDQLTAGKLLAFDFGGRAGDRPLYLIHHRRSILSPIAQAFCDYVKAAAPEQQKS